MLTCIARPKSHGNDSAVNPKDDSDSAAGTPNTKQGLRTLSSQIKGMAMKASGAYKCYPCAAADDLETRIPERVEIGFGSDRLTSKGSSSYRRTVSSRWGKEMEARLKVISSGEGTPSSASSGRGVVEPVVVVVVEETEPKEWVAQVEPGVLITFVSLPRGGNDLKRIRFSRDMFNKWQAQKWWTENYEKVMELYNVQRLNRQAFPHQTPPRSEDEISKMESIGGGSPVTPPLTKENLPFSLYRGGGGTAIGYSSSDSFEQHTKQSHQQYGSSGPASTAKHSNNSGAKTETSSMDDSIPSTSSRDADRSEELSVSNASDMETEWVEEDEPGVYITIRALPGGRRELRRVRFSRERFGEMHARLWWEENRARVHEQYL